MTIVIKENIFERISKMKIAVAGTGYVGLSLSTLLSQYNEVYALDINEKKVKMINDRISPIEDEDIERFFREKNLHLTATLDYKEAFKDAQFIIISTPTNYNEELNYFDTSSVEDIIKKIISMNLNTTMIVKSTVPVGFIDNIKEKYGIDNILFSPEFLREGKALYDNLYPSRIIIGEDSERAREFANLLKQGCEKKDVSVKFMGSKEAEAVKLFANTYLALRISFFNELDTYAEVMRLNSRDIIEGVSLDPRIGNYYNNPSFGYGGYCLPKETRKDYIAEIVLKNKPKVVGIYRLTMKTGSDNFRESAIQGIINRLEKNVEIIIYEPTLITDKFHNCKVVKNL